MYYKLHSFGDDIDDDGGSDERCDGIQWNHSPVARKHTDGVGKKRYGSSGQDSGRQEFLMVFRAENHAGDMGYDKSATFVVVKVDSKYYIVEN